MGGNVPSLAIFNAGLHFEKLAYVLLLIFWVGGQRLTQYLTKNIFITDIVVCLEISTPALHSAFAILLQMSDVDLIKIM